METHLEKRKCRRYKAGLELKVDFAGLPDTLNGKTINISSQGVYFQVPRTESLELGGRVLLDILMPEDYAVSGATNGNRMFRIRAVGSIVRLLHDAEMDISRIAVSFTRHRLTREGESERSRSASSRREGSATANSGSHPQSTVVQ